MTMRMLPAIGGALPGKPITANGRAYAATAGSTVDVPNQDESVMEANGWFDCGGKDCLGVGTTAQRPTAGLWPGALFIDTTVAAIITYDGATWRNPVTGAAV